jgi:Glu-tRNA(Gln) amidotransferase subunit E-like FAD-binding protein
MEKSLLLARISKLAALAHSDDLSAYSLSEQAINEIKATLDTLTEEYVATYC